MEFNSDKTTVIVFTRALKQLTTITKLCDNYEGWNFNSGNYLFTTDTK